MNPNSLQVASRNVDTRLGLARGGLVCKAHRLLYHSTLGLRVIKKKKVGQAWDHRRGRARSCIRDTWVARVCRGGVGQRGQAAGVRQAQGAVHRVTTRWTSRVSLTPDSGVFCDQICTTQGPEVNRMEAS